MFRTCLYMATVAHFCLGARAFGEDLKPLPQEESFHCAGMLVGITALRDLSDESKVTAGEDLKKRGKMKDLSASAQPPPRSTLPQPNKRNLAPERFIQLAVGAPQTPSKLIKKI